jgi:hypothetical protein
MYRSIGLLFVVMLFGACRRQTSLPAPDGIVGQWELTAFNGGIAGDISYPPGNGNTLQFSSNGDFKQTFANNPPKTGAYTLQASNSQLGDEILTIIYSATSYDRDSVRINPRQLILLPLGTCCDLPTTFYRRIP